METNRIEDVARDGIHTLSSVTRTAAHSGGEVASEVAAVLRHTLESWIEVAGGVARTVVRVTADVAIEIVDSFRSAATALVAPREAREHDETRARRPGNGSSELHASA